MRILLVACYFVGSGHASSSWLIIRYREDPSLLSWFVQMLDRARHLFTDYLGSSSLDVLSSPETLASLFDDYRPSEHSCRDLWDRLGHARTELYSLHNMLQSLRSAFFVNSPSSPPAAGVEMYSKDAFVDALMYLREVFEHLVASGTGVDRWNDDFVEDLSSALENPELLDNFRRLELLVQYLQKAHASGPIRMYKVYPEHGFPKSIAESQEDGHYSVSLMVDQVVHASMVLRDIHTLPHEKALKMAMLLREFANVERAVLGGRGIQNVDLVIPRRDMAGATTLKEAMAELETLGIALSDGNFCKDFLLGFTDSEQGLIQYMQQIGRLRKLIPRAYSEVVAGLGNGVIELQHLVRVSTLTGLYTYSEQYDQIFRFREFITSDPRHGDSAYVAALRQAVELLQSLFWNFLDMQSPDRVGRNLALLLMETARDTPFQERFSQDQLVSAWTKLVSELDSSLWRMYVTSYKRDDLVTSFVRVLVSLSRHPLLHDMHLLDEREKTDEENIRLGDGDTILAPRKGFEDELAKVVEILTRGGDVSNVESNVEFVSAVHTLAILSTNVDAVRSAQSSLGMFTDEVVVRLLMLWDAAFSETDIQGLAQDEQEINLDRLNPYLVSYMSLYPVLVPRGTEHHFCARLFQLRFAINALLDTTGMPQNDLASFWRYSAEDKIVNYCPSALSLTWRLAILQKHVHSLDGKTHPVIETIRMDHQQALEKTYQRFRGMNVQSVRKANFRIEFAYEQGVDAGGLKRDWYTLVTQALFNPEYNLFEETHVGSGKYKPCADSGMGNEAHLKYFRFAGQFIAKAILDSQAIPVHFTRSFYKIILFRYQDMRIDLADYEYEAPEHYHHLVSWLRGETSDDVFPDMTFTADTLAFGVHKEIELIPGGSTVHVDSSNKHDYVRKLIEYKMKTSINESLNAFLEGFYSIIPHDIIRRMFTPEELEIVIAGIPDVDIDDLCRNTAYTGYTRDSPQIVWFWDVIQEMNREQLLKLLKFVTGSTQVPVGGFAYIREAGTGRLGAFTIARRDIAESGLFNDNPLPTAHTCFNKLDLPEYSTKDELRKKLMLALGEGLDRFELA